MNKFKSIYRSASRWLTQQKMALTTSGLLLLFGVVYIIPFVCVTVKSGQAGILYKPMDCGTVLSQSYPEGLHLVYPWDHMYIYDMRIQEQEHHIELLTRNGLQIEFRISVSYRPLRGGVAALHQEVGPDYPAKIVIPQITSLLRREVGQFTAEEIYTTQAVIADNVLREARERGYHYNINIDNFAICSVALPPEVKKAVESKIEQLHLAESYKHRLDKERYEACRKEIEAEGQRRFNEIVGPTLSAEILRLRSIEAARELAASPNSKTVVIGGKDSYQPLIVGPQP